MPGFIKRLLKPTLLAGALVAAAGLTMGASQAEARGCGGWGYGGGYGGYGYGYGARPVVVARPVVPVNYGYHRGGFYGPRQGYGAYGVGYRGYGGYGRGVSIGFGF